MTKTQLHEQVSAEWQAQLDSVPADVLAQVRHVAKTYCAQLASLFYERMLADPAASTLLDHEQVSTKLHGSMQRWIVGLFNGGDAAACVAQQAHVGHVHARIDVPMHLVLRGARFLKQHFGELLHADDVLDPPRQRLAADFAAAMIDLAMEVMAQTYHLAHDRDERAAEAYRVHSITQNLSTERERQRAALLDWENQIMFHLAMGASAQQLPRIGESEFGLWFQHKGADIFQGMTEVEQIQQTFAHIDGMLLPFWNRTDGEPQSKRLQELRDLRERSKGIVFLLDLLFQQSAEIDAGRDVLTRLLNRKFLPVIMTKEVKYARTRNTGFTVLVVDIDYFKKINDEHGHEAGDLVLQQIGAILLNASRGSDYVFRLGGEEFLMLLVNIDGDKAWVLAERLRQQIEKEQFRLSADQSTRLTVSIGIAAHDGHPDYQSLLRRGDQALYDAKRQGRNRVAAA